MTVARSVAEVLRDHVTLEVEGIDRMYLNVYVPMLQSERGIAWFFREHRGHSFASSALMAPMTRDFVDAIEAFARTEAVPLISFEKHARKDVVVEKYRQKFRGTEGVVVIGKAQEKASVFRTGRRVEAKTGRSYAWLYRKRLLNLPALREVGFKANRRLLDVQRISHDCAIGEDAFHDMQRSRLVSDQRAAALRFEDPRVLALLHAIVLFRLLPNGFSNRDLRERVAPLRGTDVSAGRMTYDLRRLRLHGLIRRIPRTRRYETTDHGLRIAMFFTRAYDRLFRPGLAVILPDQADGPLHASFRQVEAAMDAWCERARMAA